MTHNKFPLQSSCLQLIWVLAQFICSPSRTCWKSCSFWSRSSWRILLSCKKLKKFVTKLRSRFLSSVWPSSVVVLTRSSSCLYVVFVPCWWRTVHPPVCVCEREWSSGVKFLLFSNILRSHWKRVYFDPDMLVFLVTYLCRGESSGSCRGDADWLTRTTPEASAERSCEFSARAKSLCLKLEIFHLSWL